MRAIVVAGLQFGDEGKGSIVDYLVRKYGASLVVRYNGGAQAAHHVVTPDGKSHCFSQWGSGTLAGVPTYLSKHCIIDPLAMLAEAKHLQELGIARPFDQLMVDPNALVVTPFQRAMNRAREDAAGAGRHGSCGLGIGEAVMDMLDGMALRAKHLYMPDVLRERLRLIARAKLQDAEAFTESDAYDRHLQGITIDEVCDTFTEIAQVMNCVTLDEAFAGEERIVFEGAQGVLLDEWYGFHPHTTWSTTTFANALELIDEIGFDEVTRIGVLRAFTTRHGAGPFPTESFGVPAFAWKDERNRHDGFQGALRVGCLDLVLLRYALMATAGADALALTCVDRIGERTTIAESYRVPFRRWGTRFFLSDHQRSLWVGPHRDLDYRGAVTRLLQQCRPGECRVAVRDELAGVLGEALGVPVAIVSHGPTADDKTDTRPL